MKDLHLSINDMKLIDLKNPRFMYSNGYRTLGKMMTCTEQRLKTPVDPTIFKHTQLFFQICGMRFHPQISWTHHTLGDPPWNSTTSHGRISRFPGHSGASPQWMQQKHISCSCLAHLYHLYLADSCFFSDIFFSMLYQIMWHLIFKHNM